MLLLLVACTAGPAERAVPETTGTAASAPTTIVTTTAPLPATQFGDLPERTTVTEIELDGRNLRVAVAATVEERSQGLRGVTDLGDLDGMLFRWDTDLVSTAFTMAGTLIPLDIAFFAADGSFVDGFRMDPCETDPCPTYAAAAPYAFALETPASALPAPGPGSRLVVEP